MSVDVHTSPTTIALDHKWEPKSPPPVFSEGETSASIDVRRNSYSGCRKRRFQHNRGGFQMKRRRYSSKSQMILPSKFLLGGNISDPLNLNGLSESDEVTPVSSPLPTGHKDNVNIIIPPNITDPLNLVESDDDANDELFYNLAHKKKKHKRKHSKDVKDLTLGPLNIDIENGLSKRGTDCKVSPAIPKDKIVSPVIPQTNQRTWKRRRTNSEGPQVTRDEEPIVKVEQPQRQVPKPKRQNSSQKTKKRDSSNKKETKFIHGNYNRYYGYRNPNSSDDQRIRYFDASWFEGKEILDVGCNTGHVTLTVARDFKPLKIVGVDIDGYLIGIARKNIRHYLLTDMKETEIYPASMAKCYGPLIRSKLPEFPNNVFFRQGDFVLESDELLDMQKAEYDVIMALSITKWIHLNHGDVGLKRTFKRFYRMLRPGGKLILEPQGWASYGKRKKLTDTIFKNYQSIRFRPEHFKDFLMSRHVGFTACQELDIPFNKAQGFRRPVIVFTKQSQSEPTVTFDLPIRVLCKPTPVRNEQVSQVLAMTPNSVDNPKSLGTPFSAPGTPFSVQGTPGRSTPYYAPSPCSVQSCSECKRRIEYGLTNGTESPVSVDYCSQCSGSMTPGKWSAGGRTPASQWSAEGAPERQSDDDDPRTPYDDPGSCDPQTPGGDTFQSCDPPTSVEQVTYEPHTPLGASPSDSMDLEIKGEKDTSEVASPAVRSEFLNGTASQDGTSCE